MFELRLEEIRNIVFSHVSPEGCQQCESAQKPPEQQYDDQPQVFLQSLAYGRPRHLCDLLFPV